MLFFIFRTLTHYEDIKIHIVWYYVKGHYYYH